MFIDEASIEVQAGRGGDGCASLRREKFIPKGGPDGGDGGDGGHVYLRVKEDIHGMAGLVGVGLFHAGNGEPGLGKKMYGRKGKSITVDVPPGTLVFEKTKEIGVRSKELGDRPDSSTSVLPDVNSDAQNDNQVLLIDTAELEEGQTFLLAKGGKGGLGNVHFANATHQTPREFTVGTRGQHRHLRLVVKHIADVGLVGLPNVGKSTFLARVSHAKPKVADYPFTTLEPHLGVAQIDQARFVIADIPGLIEGASAGKGLGHKFLRHIERTKVLLHLIDAQSTDPVSDYAIIRAELGAYNPTLLERPEVIAISRIDTLDQLTQKQLIKQLGKQLGKVYPLSSTSGQGLPEILRTLSKLLTAKTS